jgi:hypothetical protein
MYLAKDHGLKRGAFNFQCKNPDSGIGEIRERLYFFTSYLVMAIYLRTMLLVAERYGGRVGRKIELHGAPLDGHSGNVHSDV